MTPGRPTLARFEVPAALALVAAAAWWAGRTQVFQVFRYWDSDEYFLMAEQLASGHAVTAASPYAYRLLTPWLVGTCCAGDLQRGFLVLNLLAGAATAVLLVYWLRHFVQHAGVRLLMVAAFAWQWHGPVRFVFYYPAYVDPLFQLFLLAALIAGEHLRARPSLAAGLGYTALTAIGTLSRETMLVVPAAAALGAVAARRLAGLVWPVAAGAAGVGAFVAARLATTPREGYGFLDAVWLHLTHKPVESIVLVWFIAFGPMVAITVYDWRATFRFLRSRVDLAAVPLACIALAYVGGHDTERYLFWAMPVVYLLVAQSIERQQALVSHALVAGVAAAAQLVSQRVFWPVPDPGTAVAALSGISGWPERLYAVANRVFVIDDFHWNLWSNFGSRPFHLVQLAFYLAVSAAIIALMRRRAVHLAVRA